MTNQERLNMFFPVYGGIEINANDAMITTGTETSDVKRQRSLKRWLEEEHPVCGPPVSADAFEEFFEGSKDPGEFFINHELHVDIFSPEHCDKLYCADGMNNNRVRALVLLATWYALMKEMMAQGEWVLSDDERINGFRESWRKIGELLINHPRNKNNAAEKE